MGYAYTLLWLQSAKLIKAFGLRDLNAIPKYL